MRQTDHKEEGDGNIGWPDAPAEPNDIVVNGRQRSQRHNGEYERENALAREAPLAREEFDDVHSRLDKLTSQLERRARGADPLQGAPPEPQ